MIIPKTPLFTLVVIFCCLTSIYVAADEPKESFFQSGYARFKTLILDPPATTSYLNPRRGKVTDTAKITTHSDLTLLQNDPPTLSGCIETLPYDHMPLMTRIGHAARVMANHSEDSIEQFGFQPHFSGLKGPHLHVMRKDIERALLTDTASANEIYHNASFAAPRNGRCRETLKAVWDLELNHKADLSDSDHAPIIKSEVIVNNRIHFAGSFLATVSARYLLYDNFKKDNGFRLLNRTDPVRQDELGYLQNRFGLNRIMLSGFATLVEDFYIAGHAGYLEEMFMGLGGEFLYRPHDSAFSLGGEVWSVMKRVPYAGSFLAVEDSIQKTSALLNLWYDTPVLPMNFGLSAGRFLDGDIGYQIHSTYKPAAGWQLKAYATHSAQDDATVTKRDSENWIFGGRLTMPLGRIKNIPDNSRQTVTIEPFARDHGQTLDNSYPLYDLTDAWQLRNIKTHWQDITHSK